MNAQTTIEASDSNLGTYDVVYTMTDTVDTSITRTYTLTLIVINDVCTPAIDIQGISITDPLEYVIGDSAL